MTQIHSTWCSPCGRYTVALTTSCVGEMLDLARQRYPKEVGSALTGSYSDDGFVATVSGLTPMASDSRSARFGFRRGVRGLLEFLRHLFQASGGLVHYVGEWHSHPGGAAVPSGTDDRNQLAIAKDPSAKCPECILVLLATSGDEDDIGVFVYSRKRGKIPLHRTEQQE